MDKCILIDLENHTDARGLLYSYENLNFETKRFFFIGVNNIENIRGNHGHFECTQLFIPLMGDVEVKIKENGVFSTILLKEGKALLVPPLNHCTISFKESNTRLMVLASHKYDVNDYFE